MSNQAVISNGGHRSHNIHIDQYYSGGVMSYQSIVIDVFPSGQNAQLAFLSCKVERESGLLDMYSMIVRPTRNPLFIVKALGFLSPILSRWLGTNVMSDMPATTHGQSPEKWPTPETITKFKSHDRTVPFCNMNLNKYYSTEGDTSGNIAQQKEHNKLSAKMLPYLASVKAYPSMIAEVIGVFVGNERSQLYDEWTDILMVDYPSRQDFLNMVSNAPEGNIEIRDNCIERALMTPSTYIQQK